MVDYGQAAIRARFKRNQVQRDLPESTQIDAPPNPKVAQFLKELPQRGRRVRPGPGRDCFNVLRTAKYNKPLGKVKKKFATLWITFRAPVSHAARKSAFVPGHRFSDAVSLSKSEVP